MTYPIERCLIVCLLQLGNIQFLHVKHGARYLDDLIHNRVLHHTYQL